ncbi:SPW repeat protein [Actinoplanes oblitus]|uniref:SPW repeat protein n=1 Tax=Actinoplanes oblitus TaxID=3040509 RepID=A0ABY8W695_9ACTN|nr:SPW repeat protein [Actinoplanes oblitus]WIM92538.1 SPW repeat protein [Actinoplanes oblitus]
MHLSPPLRHWHPARDTRRLVAELVHSPSELLVLIGVWLTAAPLIFSHNSAVNTYAGWSDVISGLGLVVLAYLRVMTPAGTTWMMLLTAALGAWVIAAPFVRGYAEVRSTTWNDVLVGTAVIALSFASWWLGRRKG